MAKRFTDTEIWDKEWFMTLSSRHKLLIRFLYDKCDCAGVWAPNWILASAYIGESISVDDLGVLSGLIEVLPGGKVFIPDFVNFQYGELSNNCRPHAKIILTLKKHGLYERVCKGYAKGMDTLEDKDKGKEQDKEGKEWGKKGAEPPDADAGSGFENAWSLYGRKGNRKTSFARWSKLPAKAKKLALEHIPRYVGSTPDMLFRKNFETYINQEAWNDEIITDKPTSNARHQLPTRVSGCSFPNPDN